MQEFITNFHFMRPFWLLLLLLAIFGYKVFFSSIKSSSAWEKVCDKNLLDFLLVKGSSKQRYAIINICFVAFFASIIALAGPSWKKQEIPTYAPQNPIMILLNLSSEMSNKDVSPTRLSRAKFAISDMLELVGNTQTGLIIYTNEPYLISPITQDNQIIKNLLPAIDSDIMPANGDRLDRAIDFGVNKMKDAGFANGQIVIFSGDVGQDFKKSLEAATSAQKQGYNVNAVEISAKKNDKLELIASKGNGTYIRASKDLDSMSRLVEFMSSVQSLELKKSDSMQENWEDFGYYLLIIPLLVCLYLFRKGIFAILFLLAISTNANAGFFTNSNQDAKKAFDKQDYAIASKKFDDPEWKAAANYKAKNYENAYKYYSKFGDITSLYNQGNALAKSGKIKEAIAKYEEVLAQDTKHEDAKFNLEYLKKQQQNQQQNQDNENSEQEDKEQDKNKQQEQEQSSPDKNKQQEKEEKQQQNQQNQEQEQSSEASNNKEDNKNPEQEENQQQQEQESGASEQKNNEQAQTKAMSEKKEDNQKNNEQVQARAQQYRNIPEDTGGLLRAFIKKEYIKNRYEDK